MRPHAGLRTCSISTSPNRLDPVVEAGAETGGRRLLQRHRAFLARGFDLHAM